MIRYLVSIAAFPVLAACGQTDHTPDSANPAHCLAAFNSADYWIKKKPGRKALQMELTGNAMTLYVFDKLKKRGELEDTLAETKAFIKASNDDPKVMTRLLVECGKAVQNESRFSQNQAYWLRLARSGSARCQQDRWCRAAP